MQEMVAIVLNEREAAKARAAELLEKNLNDLNITTSRIPVDEKINEVLLARHPSVVVLDYLLGDYSTGLDVLINFEAMPLERRPQVFFLTDEPSVPVAVEAMRLGAKNYYELDNPQSVNKLTRDIHQLIRDRRLDSHLSRPKEKILGLDDLIAHAKKSRQVINQCATILKKGCPVAVIHGPPGSGRTTLAQALFKSSRTGKPVRSIDLRFYSSDLKADLGITSSSLGPKLGLEYALILENAQEDNGELLESMDSYLGRAANNRFNFGNTLIMVLCTHELETARAWKRLIQQCEIIELPPLSERAEDIPVFVQRFVGEAGELLDQKIKSFDGKLTAWLAGLDWPGEVTQLRSVILDAALNSESKGQTAQEIIEEKRALWESSTTYADSIIPSSLTAASMLEICGHNYRIAAARLGCSVKKLFELTHSNGRL